MHKLRFGAQKGLMLPCQKRELELKQLITSEKIYIFLTETDTKA